jgi:hypothetical protein
MSQPGLVGGGLHGPADGHQNRGEDEHRHHRQRHHERGEPRPRRKDAQVTPGYAPRRGHGQKADGRVENQVHGIGRHGGIGRDLQQQRRQKFAGHGEEPGHGHVEACSDEIEPREPV